MVTNSTKKIISLLMVAVMTVLCFTSVACKKKPTQPSYQVEESVEIPEPETPADNNGNTDNSGGDADKKLTTNLPIWEKDKDFSYLLTNNNNEKLTTNLPIWEKDKDFSYLLDK